MSAYIDIVFEGDKFSPNFLKEEINLPIETIAEYGEIGKIGRYKGKPMPYGLALLKIQGNTSIELNDELNKIVNKLVDNKIILRKSGVKDITLDLESDTIKEIEIKIDKNIIKKISDLRANIEISSIEKSNLIDNGNIYLQHIYLDELYASILRDEIFHNQMTRLQKDRIDYLFKHKIDESKIHNMHLSYLQLMSRIIIYLLKYSKAKNLENIPSFEDALK